MSTRMKVCIWAENTDCAGCVCKELDSDADCVVTYDGTPDELLNQALELIRLGLIRRDHYLIRSAHSLTAEVKPKLTQCREYAYDK